MSKREALKDLYNRELCIYKNPNKVKCFFSTLDQKLEGNKLYDWYWWNIWSNLWNFIYTKPLERRSQRKYNKQRIKYGVSEQDCWSIPDWLLDTMYHALTNFLMGEYGSTSLEAIDWKEHACSTHDKKLFKDIQKYLSEYEHLLNIRKRIEIFDSGNDPAEVWYPEYKEMLDREYEIEQTCIKLLSGIISKHLAVLWW